MAVIGSLSVKLGLVTVQWDQATAKAKQQAKDLQKSFGDLTGNVKNLGDTFVKLGGSFTAGALGMGYLIDSTIEFSSKIKDLAKGFDISIAKILQFEEAIKTSGGNAEGAEKMLSTLFTKMQEARSGNEVAIAQFEQLGITFEELINLKPEQAITRIFDALSAGSTNTFQKVRLVKEMLGQQGIGLSLNEVSEKLHHSTAEFDKHADSLAKVAKISENLKESMDNLKIAVADMIAPFTHNGTIGIETFKSALLAITSAYVIGQVIKLVKLFAELRVILQAEASLIASITAMQGFTGLAQVATGASVFLASQALYGSADGQSTKPKDNSRSAMMQREMESDSASDKAAEISRREIVAATAKVELAKQLTQLEHEQSLIKIKSINGDKLKTELALLEIERKKTIAGLDASKAQALNKEYLSEAQKKEINDEYNQQVERANQKARDDGNLLYAQHKKLVEILDLQYKTTKQNFDLDKDSNEVKLKAIGMDKLAVDNLSAQLQYKTEIAHINQQEEAAKIRANQNLAEELHAIRTAKTERQAAEDRLKFNREFAQKNYQLEIDAIQRLRQAQEQTFALDVRAQVLDQNKYKMRESDVRIAQEQLDLERKLTDLRRQQNEAQIRMGQGESYEVEKRRIDDLIAAEQQLSEARQRAIVKEEERRRSFTEGFNDAFRKFAIDAENYSKLGSDVFNTAIGSMNSAIDNFVKTGKLSFKDLAKDVIQSVMAMILKFQALQIVLWGLKALGFGFGGTTSYVPTAAGGSTATAATGGEIDGPTLVGENGPEIFVPQRRGTVIPNTSASSWSSNQPSVVYNGPYINNMSAIDTQSGIQFLAKNKQTIWAVNQSANRSVPISR